MRIISYKKYILVRFTNQFELKNADFWTAKKPKKSNYSERN